MAYPAVDALATLFCATSRERSNARSALALEFRFAKRPPMESPLVAGLRRIRRQNRSSLFGVAFAQMQLGPPLAEIYGILHLKAEQPGALP